MRADDLLQGSPLLAPCQSEVGIDPKLSDAELVTLAVMQGTAPALGVHPAGPATAFALARAKADKREVLGRVRQQPDTGA